MLALALITLLAAETATEMQGLYDSAFAAFKEQKWEEAIPPLKTLTAANFHSRETGIALRVSYQFAYGVEGAIARLEEEVRKEPNDAVAHDSLGVFYLAMGRKDEARREITAALQLAPENLDFRMSLAFWYSFVGQSRAAIKEYESIVATNPEIVDAHVELCDLISNRENDPKRGVASCVRALELKPESEALAVSLGTVQMRNGDLTAAEETLKKAVAGNPEGTLAQRQLAVFAMQAGRPAEARATFEALLAKNPDDVESRIWLGKTWQAERSHSNAIREYKIAYEKQGGGMLLGYLARAYLQQYFYAVIFVLLAAMGLLLWKYLQVKTPDVPVAA